MARVTKPAAIIISLAEKCGGATAALGPISRSARNAAPAERLVKNMTRRMTYPPTNRPTDAASGPDNDPSTTQAPGRRGRPKMARRAGWGGRG
jgi:hypothetical protein